MDVTAGRANDIGGMTGFVFDVIERLGAVGLAVLNVVDTFFPPIPSEVFLPVGGYLASEGRLSLVGAWVGATAGSLVGALLLYGVGREVGRDRVDRALARIPLVSGDDLDEAERWYERHGNASVLVGRLVPGVRSLVSFPAGATDMPVLRFSLLTALGSGAWNAALIAAGWALGSGWGRIEDYSSWVDLAVVVVLAVLVARFVWRRRDRISAGDGQGREAHAGPQESSR